jgi:hypothetical protein
MKDVTPLRDKEVCDTIISSYTDYKNKWQDAIRAFIEYLISEDAAWSLVPDHPSFAGGFFGESEKFRALAPAPWRSEWT